MPLLAILCLAPGLSATRSRLRGILWGSSSQVSAGTNMRQLLTRIGRSEKAAGCRLIEIEGEMIRLARSGLAVDLLAYSGGSHRLASLDQDALANLVRSHGGDLLGDYHPDDDSLDEWLDRARNDVRAMWVHATVSLLQHGTGTPAEDLDLASRLLAVDPTHEMAYRARIRAYGTKGDIARCRAAYLECERVLKAELVIAPSAETQALAARFFEPAGPPVPVPDIAPPIAIAPLAGAGRPKVAILPPVDPFDDRRLRELASYLLEDLTVGLARFRSFRIIAAHTALGMASGPLRGMNARDWCDYVVASSLSGSPGAFEIKFRLTDARTSEVIWASSVPFDGADLPGLYTTLSERAVASLATTIEAREVDRAAPPEDRGAYRLFLEGTRHAATTDLREIRRARRLFKQAAAREPAFAAARAGVARTLSLEWLMRGAPDPTFLRDAVEQADDAIALDPRDGRGFREKAYALLYMKRHDQALALFSEAAERNPNDADLLASYADALAHSGDPEAALTVLDRASVLNPQPPVMYRWIRGSIHFQMRRYYEAIVAMQPTRRDPATARLLAACYAEIGDEAGARACARLARQSLPDFETDKLWTIVPNRNPADTRHLIQGLRRAGFT